MGPPGGVPHGGVEGPSGDTWAGIAGEVGRSLRVSGVGCPLNRPPDGGVEKKIVCAAVRKHVA